MGAKLIQVPHKPRTFPPHRVQELKLEEQQCQLDEKLRSYMNKEGECQHVQGEDPCAWCREQVRACGLPSST